MVCVAGSVFPSGCHRHPSKIMVGRPLLYTRPNPAQLISYRNYSDRDLGSLTLSESREKERRELNVSYQNCLLWSTNN